MFNRSSPSSLREAVRELMSSRAADRDPDGEVRCAARHRPCYTNIIAPLAAAELDCSVHYLTSIINVLARRKRSFQPRTKGGDGPMTPDARKSSPAVAVVAALLACLLLVLAAKHRPSKGTWPGRACLNCLPTMMPFAYLPEQGVVRI